MFFHEIKDESNDISQINTLNLFFDQIFPRSNNYIELLPVGMIVDPYNCLTLDYDSLRNKRNIILNHII